LNHRPLSLEPLTLPDVNGGELIRCASLAGFDAVGLVLYSPHPSLPVDRVVDDLDLRQDVLADLHRTGLRVQNIECFNLTPEADPASFGRSLVCAHQFGAQTATAVAWENTDRADVLSKLRRLCDMAQELGIRINIEFLALSNSLRSLDAAVELLKDCGRANIGVMVDLLHLMRSGGTVADIRALDPEFIGGAQICDGPLEMSQELLLFEAGGNRAQPGDGCFPIVDFVDALPAALTVGVEVPQTSQIGKVTALDRAQRLMSATRRALAAE